MTEAEKIKLLQTKRPFDGGAWWYWIKDVGVIIFGMSCYLPEEVYNRLPGKDSFSLTPYPSVKAAMNDLKKALEAK